jgi:hypothetical protein
MAGENPIYCKLNRAANFVRRSLTYEMRTLQKRIPARRHFRDTVQSFLTLIIARPAKECRTP